jgi:predicted lipoprotein
MNRLVVILCCTALIGGLLWLFPLFHIQRLDRLSSAKTTQSTSAREFAASFWEEKVIPTLEGAAEAEELIAALRDNPQAASKRLGRKVGVSRMTLFMVRGKGKVVTIDKSGVGIALEQGSEKADIVLHTGLVFGNAVRDSTGLLTTSDFHDSRQFNEASTELNRIVETQLIARLKENASIGKHIRFIGCVEIPDQGELARPLSIIPMQVGFE